MERARRGWNRYVIRSATALLMASIGAFAGASGMDEPKSARSFHDFRPSRDGFQFANSFGGSPVAIGGFEIGGTGGGRYGICGGMSAAAADFFLAGEDVPSVGVPPSRGDALFAYLSARQMDSLGPKMREAMRFSAWMSMTDDGLTGTRMRTLEEVAEIARSLEAGVGVPLGLVYVTRAAGASGRKGAVWDNHQVLGYRAARVNEWTLDVLVYDPNYPGNDDVKLRCSADVVGAWPSLMGIEAPAMGVKVTQIMGPGRSRPVRGVFKMPYAPARPPEKLLRD